MLAEEPSWPLLQEFSCNCFFFFFCTGTDLSTDLAIIYAGKQKHFGRRQFCGGYRATWCEENLLRREGNSGPEPERRGRVQASDKEGIVHLCAYFRQWRHCVAQERDGLLRGLQEADVYMKGYLWSTETQTLFMIA